MVHLATYLGASFLSNTKGVLRARQDQQWRLLRRLPAVAFECQWAVLHRGLRRSPGGSRTHRARFQRGIGHGRNWLALAARMLQQTGGGGRWWSVGGGRGGGHLCESRLC
jgi:hypothetical protein